MATKRVKIAVRIGKVFEGQAEGYFAVGVLAFLGLSTMLCVTYYLVQRLGY